MCVCVRGLHSLYVYVFLCEGSYNFCVLKIEQCVESTDIGEQSRTQAHTHTYTCTHAHMHMHLYRDNARK